MAENSLDVDLVRIQWQLLFFNKIFGIKILGFHVEAQPIWDHCAFNL